jgi:predicted protein tyrosine phosphatase
MSSITYINDMLYVGGDPEYSMDIRGDIALLNAQVDLIIDCRSIGEARMGGWADHRDLDVPILHIPMYDDLRNQNSPQDFLDALEAVDRDYPNAKSFYIHCHMGVNRGPSMALFFMINRFGMTAKEAFLQLRQMRPGVGLAYAEQAVAAALTMTSGQVNADINLWLQFEEDYWTEDEVKTVNERIRRNRNHSMQRAYTDARGIEHITRGA